MLTWSPAFAIGVAAVDAQHEQLFAHAARFEEVVQRGASGARVAEVFQTLAAYTRTHFADEERLMREVGYPGLAEHGREHEEFTRRLQLMRPLWEREGDSDLLLGMLLALFRTWFADHITVSDQRIGEFTRARAASSGRGGPERSRARW